MNFKIDTDIDDIVEEVYDLFKNTVIDIAEKTVAQRMLQNSKSNKISFVYFYASGTRIPVTYSAIAGLKEFEKHFEFMAVLSPSKMTEQ